MTLLLHASERDMCYPPHESGNDEGKTYKEGVLAKASTFLNVESSLDLARFAQVVFDKQSPPSLAQDPCIECFEPLYPSFITRAPLTLPPTLA